MKYILSFALLLCAVTVSAQDSEVMKKNSDGTVVVNTTTLCSERGYRDCTPLNVYFKKDKVVKVEALRNKESKNYFAKVAQNLIPMYEGIKVSKAKKHTKLPMVDGCTGATFSTNAVQKNIASAIEYYEKNKK